METKDMDEASMIWCGPDTAQRFAAAAHSMARAADKLNDAGQDDEAKTCADAANDCAVVVSLHAQLAGEVFSYNLDIRRQRQRGEAEPDGDGDACGACTDDDCDDDADCTDDDVCDDGDGSE